MPAALASTDLALRLADEGVPLHAIARATKIPSSDLRSQLQEAQADGRLLELPHDDWPPGFPRDQRALQLSRLAVDHRDVLDSTLGQLFGLTCAEGNLLLALLQNGSLDKNRSSMSSNCVDVHLFHIRKRLAAFGIGISTIWGQGYEISSQDQRKAMDLILEHVALPRG